MLSDLIHPSFLPLPLPLPLLTPTAVIATTPATFIATALSFPLDHPFAQLRGSDNIIAFYTERYSRPLIIQGAGAGAAVTAHGVLSDVLKIAEIVGYGKK